MSTKGREEDAGKSEAKNTRLTQYQGKAKRKRWQEVVDAGTSQEEAEKKYIELADSLIQTHLK